jgi:hypothetical protein
MLTKIQSEGNPKSALYLDTETDMCNMDNILIHDIN